jgi:hypothetical protein
MDNYLKIFSIFCPPFSAPVLGTIFSLTLYKHTTFGGEAPSAFSALKNEPLKIILSVFTSFAEYFIILISIERACLITSPANVTNFLLVVFIKHLGFGNSVNEGLTRKVIKIHSILEILVVLFYLRSFSMKTNDLFICHL